MFEFKSKQDEKKALRIVFWCIAPILFLVFFRLFGLVFGIIYGGVFSLLLGGRYTEVITVVSFLTALMFTLLTCRTLYIQYKKHIIGDR